MGTVEHNPLPDTGGLWCHVIEFFIAPKDGHYALKALEQAIEKLDLGINPSFKSGPSFFPPNIITPGQITFYETVGEERREIILSNLEGFNESGLSAKGFTNGKTVVSRDLTRRITVKVFPDILTATTALSANMFIGTEGGY